MKRKLPADLPTLTDYLAGESNQEQNAEVERAITTDADFQDLVSKLHLTQDALRDPMHSHVNVTSVSQVLRSKIANETREKSTSANTRSTRIFNQSLWNNWRHVGAVFSAAILIMAGLWGYSSRSGNVGDSILASQTIYTTPAGERANIRLIDGTQVVLNVGSTLMIPADFGKSNRTLSLDGEALFTVVQHSKTPFVVSAGNTISKVLGTTFGVRAYGDDSIVRVVVQDGRVMTNNAVISPNNMIEVERGGKYRLKQDVTVDDYIAFATGSLVFSDVMLMDAVPSLNRWFNTEVIIADEKLKSKLLTATYGKGSISDLSEYLSATFNATVVREGKRLILYAR